MWAETWYHADMDACIIIGIILLAVAAIVLAVVLLVRRHRRQHEIFLKFDTMAGPLRVYAIKHDDDIVRVMDVQGTLQSAVYLDDERCHELVYEYTRVYDCMFAAGVPVRDVLVLGGGGYSYPRHLISQYPDVRVTCVEIDPAVTAIACRYFFLDRLIVEYDLEETGRLALVNDDARHFLEEDHARYDAIVNDCFSGLYLAEELVTIEAAHLFHEHLNQGGVYLSNVIGAIEGPRSRTLRRIMATLAQQFAHVYIIPAQPDMLTNCDNNIVIATDGDWTFEGALELEFDDDDVLFDKNVANENWAVPVVK